MTGCACGLLLLPCAALTGWERETSQAGSSKCKAHQSLEAVCRMQHAVVHSMGHGSCNVKLSGKEDTFLGGGGNRESSSSAPFWAAMAV